MRVFLVESDPISADSVAFFLERDGFEVQTFFKSLQALEAAWQAPPTLVITEIVVSDMSGLRLAESLKKDKRTAFVPILVLSVLDAEERAAQAGADGFMLKPVDRVTLVQTVRQVIIPTTGRTQ